MFSKAKRFERLLKAVPDALVGINQSGLIEFVNRQTESLFGYDRDDLIGRPIETLAPGALLQIYGEHQDDDIADRGTRFGGLDLELSGRRQDGTELPVTISVCHIDTGGVLLVVTSASDIAKGRLAVKNAQLIEAIVHYSDDAIIGGTLGGVITSWNPAAEKIYGYARNEIVGRSAALLAPGDRVAELFAHLARATDGAHAERYETKRVRKDGTVFPVSASITPIRDGDGLVVGLTLVHRDVTSQRQALETAQLLAAMVECSEDAIFASTLDDIITSWNPAAERLFGYSSKEMVGKSGKVLSPVDRTDETTSIVARIGAGQHVDPLETICARKDGTVFPVSFTVSPICSEDGAVVGASWISRDVTEHERAARYARSLIEASLDPMAVISREGQLTDVNEAVVKVTGLPRDQVIGTAFSSYFTDADKATEIYLQAFAQGAVANHPLTLRHQDGTFTEFLCNASVYRDVIGEVLGVVAATRDVTEQMLVSAAAQHLTAIVADSEDAIISRTLDGIITSWNPAAERMYGYSSEEIVGKPSRVLIPEDRGDEVARVLAKISAGEKVERFETIRVHKDGTGIPVSIDVSPIRDSAGRVIGASVIGRRMTDHR